MLCWFSSCKGVISRPHKMLVTSWKHPATLKHGKRFSPAALWRLSTCKFHGLKPSMSCGHDSNQGTVPVCKHLDLSRCQGRIDNGLNRTWTHKYIKYKFDETIWDGWLTPPRLKSFYLGRSKSLNHTYPWVSTSMVDFRLEGERRTSCKVTWRSTTSMLHLGSVVVRL